MASNKPTTEQAPAEKPAEKESRMIEFVPYGAKDKIQLSIELVKRLIAVKTKTGKTCSNEDAFKFMLMCQARKLNPFEGDAFLIGYDNTQTGGATFSLITAHQAFLKRAELHPEFDGMESGSIVLRDGKTIDLIGDWHMPNDNIMGGWATVFFKNRSHPMHKRLRASRFDKGWGIWKDDKAGMIVKCAEADALRSSFPTMLGGMFISEEMQPITATEITRAAFPEGTPQNDGKAAGATERTVTRAEVVETAADTSAPSQEPEKKAAASAPKPTLQRRQRAAPEPTRAAEKSSAPLLTDRERLKSMLAVGNCTEQDFVAAAVDEGWIDAEIGSWDKIPDDRFTEFLKPENWALVMEVLDARKTVAAAPAAQTERKSTVKPGNLL
jgi:phage recombination protein Bet